MNSIVSDKPIPKHDAAFERFCLVLSKIPSGRVCSYGHLAELAGLGGPRQACRYLRLLPPGTSLPWHRIVNAQGKLADFRHADIQCGKLQAEGIKFTVKDRIPKSYYIYES